jgi:hypothetical protein
MRKGAADACCIAPLNGQRESLTKKLFCSDVASFFNQLRADGVDKRSSFSHQGPSVYLIIIIIIY